MIQKTKINKVWLYPFYLWVFSCFLFFIFLFTQRGEFITEEAGPLFIPFSIFFSLFISWVFLKKSHFLKYLDELFKGRKEYLILGSLMTVGSLFRILKGGDSYLWGNLVKYEVSYLFFFLGVTLIFWGIKWPKKERNESSLICPNCKQLVNIKNSETDMCNQCNIALEDSKIFFKNNPDFNFENSKVNYSRYRLSKRSFRFAKGTFQIVLLAILFFLISMIFKETYL